MNINEYVNTVTQEMRSSFLKLNKQQEQELIKVYSEAGKQLVKRFHDAGDKLTQAMLKQYSNSMYNKLQDLIKKYNLSAATMPVDLQNFILNEMAGVAKVSIKFEAMFTSIPDDTVKYILSGDLYKDGKGLSERLWNYGKINEKNVQDMVAEGLSQKLSAKEIAQQLEQLVIPNQRKYTGNKQLSSGYSHVEYNSLRLARTTNTHAFQVADIQSSKQDPFVDGLQWHISDSHYSRMHGHRDICDDRDGKVFELNHVPLEHPNGLCYQTPHISKSMDDIGDEISAWVHGDDDDLLDQWYSQHKNQVEIH